ncbi:ABC transporter permease [Ornithinibacillus sp. 179-J 7C1 HS]|uniref:ABC transporter permease n=1 Tax=Ornithinibacillus sp. 179-J 7C1 HS TaxID=3142384 RepID=UPI0039A0CBF3
MVWNIIKKQGLIFLRNPQELLLLLALPIILITILSTALGGLMNGESAPIKVQVAFLEHESEGEQVDRFLEDIENKLPPEVMDEIRANIDSMLPIKQLKQSVFEQETIKEFIEVHYITSAEREEILSDDSFTSLIEVPNNFTYNTLSNLVLSEDVQPTLLVTQNEGEQVGVNIVHSILEQFQEQLTLGKFLGSNGFELEELQLNEDIRSEIVTINEKEPVTSQAYYTLGMVLMNVLFLAGAIGSFAFKEKRLHVVDRIIVANISRWVYFIGILLSGTIFAFIQSIFIFTFSRFVFGVTWPDLTSFLLVTLAFSFAVGGIAVLLVSISFRGNSDTVIHFFSGIIVTIFAVLGGSFAPVGEFSKTIQFLGNLTPNGASMTAYLTILRGEELGAIGNQLIYLACFGISAVVIAVLCFPKRGLSA